MDDVARVPLYDHTGAIVNYALIDRSDYDFVMQWRWGIARQGKGYAVRSQRINGRKRRVWMHREILGLGAGRHDQEVDHINGGTLDNRRRNLREATRAENAQNCLPHRDGTSRYRGVHWFKETAKWRATGRLHGKAYHLGYFDDELTAAKVAADWRAINLPFSKEFIRA